MTSEFRPAAKLHFDLFGNRVKDEVPPPRLDVLEFESARVRMLVIKGKPWWVLADIARVLGYRDAHNASRVLKAKHRGTHSVSTPSGDQEMAVVNESGLYRLLTRSDKAEAERFQDWLTEEVLPEIRRVGSYSGGFNDRISRKAKQLGCDRPTAEVRCKVIDANKLSHARLAGTGAIPNNFKAFNNAAYRGQFGLEATELRKALGVKKGKTPLDRMGPTPLAQHLLAKLLVDEIVRNSATPTPLDDQCVYAELVAKGIAEASLAQLGPGYRFDVREDPDRGKVLDVVQVQIPSVA